MRTKKFIPFIVAAALLIIAGGGYYLYASSNTTSTTIFSGTIEANQTNVPTMLGGQVREVYVAEGDEITKGQVLVSVHSVTTGMNEAITSPLDGVVLTNLVQVDEFAPAGSTVMVVASLNDLNLKIYVPENLYGQIGLGQAFPVMVDSFPGQTFNGTVTYISDQAQFTPRNVQTIDSRKTTVYAVQLALDPTGGMLKPGMPADVYFK
jgi:HlyD family secretion protein